MVCSNFYSMREFCLSNNSLDSDSTKLDGQWEVLAFACVCIVYAHIDSTVMSSIFVDCHRVQDTHTTSFCWSLLFSKLNDMVAR